MDSADVDELLAELGRRGWSLWGFPTWREPQVLGFTLDHGGFCDVVVIRGPDDAVAFRVPLGGAGDGGVFSPAVVVWAYVGAVDATVRAAFALAAPGDEFAPDVAMPALDACRLSAAERCRFTLRPLSRPGGVERVG